MEDMAWVLYALLGTQVILLFLILFLFWHVGAMVYEANVTLTKIGATLVGVEEKLQDQTSELKYKDLGDL